jgi:hypothetical protein
MNDKELPNNVIPIRTLQLTYDRKKHCTCYEDYPPKPIQYELDNTNREVFCKHCGERVDPFDALKTMSQRWEQVSAETQRVAKEAQELRSYKPWLKALRSIEQFCRKGEVIPTCPHCNEGIFLEELTHYTNKQMEIERRKFKK